MHNEPAEQTVHGTPVYGVQVNEQTGCAHYHSSLDIIAIRFKCCNRFYACWHCHQAVTDHQPTRWQPQEFDQPAILCGACGTQLSIRQYMGCGYVCPSCGAGFNPGCRLHNDLYFKMPENAAKAD